MGVDNMSLKNRLSVRLMLVLLLLPGRSASVADDIGHNLPGGTTQGNPYPALVGPFSDE
jgi:hypothetical protein